MKLKPFNSYQESEILNLQEKLQQYYGSVDDYTAFNSVSSQTKCWNHVVGGIKDLLKTRSICKVLEIGAGRSGFPMYLRNIGKRQFVHYTAQDITHQNEKYLISEGDDVIIGDFDNLSSKYDIIFSTYVLEHVVNPQKHLNSMYNCLQSEGVIFLFAPRYDFPFYLPPSTRHADLAIKVKFILEHLKYRLSSLLSKKCYFIIQDDLSCFYSNKFYIDSDLCHWVSVLDLKNWARIVDLNVEQLSVSSPKTFSKDWVVKKFLTTAVKISKDI